MDKLNTTVRMGDRRTRYAEGNCNQDVGNFLNNAPDLLMGLKTRRRKFLAIRKKESLMMMGRSLHCAGLGLVPDCPWPLIGGHGSRDQDTGL